MSKSLGQNRQPEHFLSHLRQPLIHLSEIAVNKLEAMTVTFKATHLCSSPGTQLVLIILPSQACDLTVKVWVASDIVDNLYKGVGRDIMQDFA